MKSLIRTETITKKYVQRGKIDGKDGIITAVNNVSLEVFSGQSLALIGESGCGKSTLGRVMCGLERSDSGKLYFENRDVTNLSQKEFRPLRRDIQMIFQNNLTAFDPKYTMRNSIEEVMGNFENFSNAQMKEKAEEMFARVGLETKLLNRLPRELSGGERQRANIARAIILKPKIVICDEPVASLDYSLRKNVLELLNKFGEEDGVTYVLITHDLSTIRYVCSKIAVMYLGEIVEVLDVEDIENDIAHPYTRLLFDSVLIADPSKRGTIQRGILKEDMGLISRPGNGCLFHERCAQCTERCRQQHPEMKQVGKNHFVACHKY